MDVEDLELENESQKTVVIGCFSSEAKLQPVAFSLTCVLLFFFPLLLLAFGRLPVSILNNNASLFLHNLEFQSVTSVSSEKLKGV